MQAVCHRPVEYINLWQKSSSVVVDLWNWHSRRDSGTHTAETVGHSQLGHPEASATICNDFWCAATGFAQFLRVHYHTNGEYPAAATCHMPHATHTSTHTCIRLAFWTQTKVNFLMPAPKRFYLVMRCQGNVFHAEWPEPGPAWPEAGAEAEVFYLSSFFMI